MRGVRSGGRAASARTAPGAQELLAAIATGDHDAFAAYYDLTAAAVYGTVRRVLRDPAQSEEVTQEVFLEVWRTAARFDPERGSAATWLMVMAHRRAVDRVRAAEAASQRDTAVAARDADPPYDVVADAVETRLEHEQVRAALASLTDVQRQAVELAYYGGRSQAEVAALLGIPLGTVKTRIRDGLIRLRDVLGVTA